MHIVAHCNRSGRGGEVYALHLVQEQYTRPTTVKRLEVIDRAGDLDDRRSCDTLEGAVVGAKGCLGVARRKGEGGAVSCAGDREPPDPDSTTALASNGSDIVATGAAAGAAEWRPSANFCWCTTSALSLAPPSAPPLIRTIIEHILESGRGRKCGQLARNLEGFGSFGMGFSKRAAYYGAPCH